MASRYFDKATSQAPEFKELAGELSVQYENKQWHQLSLTLVDVIKKPYLANNKPRLADLYNEFVSKFATRVNPLILARIGAGCAKHASNPTEFLEKIKKIVASDSQAVLLCSLQAVVIKMNLQTAEDCKGLLDDCSTALDAYPGIMDAVVLALYHKAFLDYYALKGPAAQYYTHALQYLTYQPLSEMTDDERQKLALNIGLAALVGEDIYSFGELLQHPIIGKLQGTDLAWLAELLTAFNGGNIEAFERLVKAHPQDVLVSNTAFLAQKIRIMALVSFIFDKPADGRVFTFEEIAVACRVQVPEVQLLLMKAFSIGVVKGTIDQVDGNVHITWVQPCVLSDEQLNKMRSRIADWSVEVSNLAEYVQQNAEQIVQTR